MRSGCQWCLTLLLVAGCGGAPPERTASGSGESGAVSTPRSADETTAAQATPVPPTTPVGVGPASLPDRLTATGARHFLAAHAEALVLDVRNPDEWNDDLGHIDRARQIPLPELPAREGEIAAWKDKPIVVVCRAGGRSHEAAVMLREAGFRQVMNLEGGMLAWRSSEKVARQSH